MPKMENATALVEERGSVGCQLGGDTDANATHALRALVLGRCGCPHNRLGLIAVHAFGEPRDD